MKQFFKMVLACLVAVIIAGVFLLIISIGALTAALSFQSTSVTVADKSVLTLKFDKPIVDRQIKNPLSIIFSNYSEGIGLNTIYSSVERAKSDPKIKGIYLDVSNLSGSLADIEEIRGILKDFRSTGKFVIAYADNFSQSAYFLSTAADKIYLNPYGEFNLVGLSSQSLFYKGLTDKLGVEMQIIRHGKFKAAVEPFLLDKMSDESKIQTLSVLSSIWSTIIGEISKDRNIEMASLNQWADQLAIKLPSDALEKGLVDGLKYKDEILEELTKLSESASVKDLALVSLSNYADSPNGTITDSEDKIAVIYASGEIKYGSNDDKLIMSDDLAKEIRKARTDKDVKAIVFRVNSPGGSVIASEIIAREIELAQKVKPVVVSMGGLAASGGYWVSCMAQDILANKTTITGSIGVFGMIPYVEKGLKQHLGITTDGVKTNAEGQYNIFQPLSLAQRSSVQYQIENIYSNFIGKVAIGRKISVAAVDSIGQGRIWSGADALTHKLIDRFGGLSDAVNLAKERAGISTYKIEELPSEKHPFEMLEALGSNVKSYVSHSEMEYTFEQYNRLMSQMQNTGILARIPYDIDIY